MSEVKDEFIIGVDKALKKQQVADILSKPQRMNEFIVESLVENNEAHKKILDGCSVERNRIKNLEATVISKRHAWLIGKIIAGVAAFLIALYEFLKKVV